MTTLLLGLSNFNPVRNRVHHFRMQKPPVKSLGR